MNFVQIILALNFLHLCSCNFQHDKSRDSSNLKMLFAIWRHGSRSPIALIPNDPNNKEWSKTCLGELTNVGKKEQMENGRLTLKRYKQLLGERYNCSTLYVQSSTIPRAVMSGSSFMAGVYEPEDDQVWTSESIGREWQPIPIYTTDIASGQILAISVPADLRSTDLYTEYKVTIDAIANATGASLNSFAQVFYYIDALACEAYLNYRLPFGLHKYKDDLTPMVGKGLAIFMQNIYVKVAAILLKDAIKRIDAFKSGQSLVDANFYSLHDAHVYAVMSVLTGQTVGQPPFSSTIYIELREDENSEYVQLWYRPTIRSDPKDYAIKDCGLKCPLEQFRALVNSLNN